MAPIEHKLPHPTGTTNRLVIAVVAVAVVAIAAVVLVATQRGHATDGLPPVGARPPTDYRIVYAVTTPDSASTEEHVVHRPFGAFVQTRDANGKVTSERWSALGHLTTRSQGYPAVRIDTAIAPAASDLRPDLFTGPMTDLKRLKVGGGGPISIGDRACRRSVEAQKLATAGDAAKSVGQTGTLPVTVTRCVDRQGLVLEERWASPGGRNLITKRAVELELGDDVPTIHEPRARRLPAEQGNGSVERVARSTPMPFADTFRLATPKGFTFVGRYAVVPARLAGSAGPLPPDAGIELYTDVWRRGADVLLLDQGVTTSGRPPFDARTAVGPVDIKGPGQATVAYDLRLAEVRFTRPDGGFARLAGTIAPAELVRLASTLQARAT
jgi:hypothetical protein